MQWTIATPVDYTLLLNNLCWINIERPSENQLCASDSTLVSQNLRTKAASFCIRSAAHILRQTLILTQSQNQLIFHSIDFSIVLIEKFPVLLTFFFDLETKTLPPRSRKLDSNMSCDSRETLSRSDGTCIETTTTLLPVSRVFSPPGGYSMGSDISQRVYKVDEL